MANEDSLGPMGPNVISVESMSDTVYSVQGNNFTTGFHVEVKNGVDQIVEGVTTSQASGTAFTLTLPYVTPGPYTLVVLNPDGRTSTKQVSTPGTSSSNDVLRANS